MGHAPMVIVGHHVVLLCTLFGDPYKMAATDVFFADALLSIVTIPTSAFFLKAIIADKRCRGVTLSSNTFNSLSGAMQTSNLPVGILMFSVFTVTDLFLLTQFFFWPA